MFGVRVPVINRESVLLHGPEVHCIRNISMWRGKNLIENKRVVIWCNINKCVQFSFHMKRSCNFGRPQYSPNRHIRFCIELACTVTSAVDSAMYINLLIMESIIVFHWYLSALMVCDAVHPSSSPQYFHIPHTS